MMTEKTPLITKEVRQNIYGKLQNVRKALSETKLTKSGYNSHADFHYFELADFLPTITNLMYEAKLCSTINFGKKLAVLTIINAEKPDEQIKFYSPVGAAKVSSIHEAQNIGASQTYVRRYLYMNTFEIVDGDALDASNQRAEVETKQQQTATDQKQVITNAGEKKCPQCGKTLVTKTNKQNGNPFLACPGFPDCKYIYKEPKKVETETVREEGENNYTDEDIPF